MGKTKGLRYIAKNWVDDHYKNRSTNKVYRRSVDKFCDFVISSGYTKNYVLNHSVEVVQAYSYYLSLCGKYSSFTIHNYLTCPCAFLKIPMDKIEKPSRHTNECINNRNGGSYVGYRQEICGSHDNLVEFQKRVGIRRDELKHLRKSDFKYDESGYPCVIVRRGKGGKYQLQRILPDYVETVKSYFDGTEAPVFDPKELKNRINLHRYRAIIAREAYNMYLYKIYSDQNYSHKLRNELIARYKIYNIAYINSNQDKKEKLLLEFNKQMTGIYTASGRNRELALDCAMPIKYNRLRLMAVSVFHLSHWRLDVTLANYLLAM